MSSPHEPSGDPAASTWTRPAPTRRERLIDLATAAGLFVAAILSQQLYRIAGVYEKPADGLLTIALLAVMTLPLALRRSHPIPTVFVVAAAFTAGGFLQVPELLINNIALFVALYSVGAWVSRRGLAGGVRTVVVIGMGVTLLLALFQSATDPDALSGLSRVGAFSPLVAYLLIQVLINLLYFAAAWWFGDRAFAGARQRAELESRTAELEAERGRTAEQAVALDRVRIARELHDAVAHHVSVIGIQAGAARTVLRSDPDAASAALQTIETTTRETIRELHEMLTTLRDPEELESARGIDRLDELVTASAEAGVPASFQVIGEPVAVPAIASVNLYRIAQEALTNVRKHAGPDATVDVRVRYGTGHVELEVANSGGVSARRLPGGLGQLGMRERVAASGGTLELGPRSRGGYLVRARIPLPEPAA
ncbi:sensor histidine kinase [Protaetiibacter larvae]|uniref:histidine kinase n=1 Tax=Protaetiibacter larvae TaxID=2592654 RepID=A0A5C1Y4M1_9MICO|nr:histidine kinase [Protaetiibacter larvae]QEO08983.1 sensor histidine kinase [Protaetiibacter larvae]